MTRALPALVALLLLALPATAPAQTNAPPGNSAIDQYLETVPGATGNQVPRKPGTGKRILTPEQRAELERLGPDGKILADAIEATAPPAPESRQRIDVDGVEGRSPVEAILDAVAGGDGGEGMGIFLPLILLGSLIGVIVLVLLRRRSPS